MSATKPLTVALGAFPVANNEGNPQAKFTTPEAAQEFISLFHKHGYTVIDTARGYGVGTSEQLLGQTDAGSWAIIDTKVASFAPGSHSAENIKSSIDASVKALNGIKPRIMYLHAPDRSTPFAETVRAIDEAHKAGHFEQFGLSNYTAEEVDEIVAICEKRGYVKPTVYQGQYNAIARLPEKELLPTLRKHGLAYYAYSPSAGGMFTGKISEASKEISGGRFDTTTIVGNLYTGNYMKKELIEAARKVHEEASKRGLSGHEVALRWVLHHSALSADKGDAMIIGASSMKQLEQNIKACHGGPLPDELVEWLERTWDVAKDVAPAPWM